MPSYNIMPDQPPLEIKTIILDLNGTLSVGGSIPEGATERLAALKKRGFRLLFLSGNTRGNADELAEELGIEWKYATTGAEKRAIAEKLEPETCASIGNGLIDLELTKLVKLGVVTLQSEGIHVQTLLQADVAVPTINDALDLFLDEKRMIATMRT
jgi:soluble P-type ATPase